jgi:clathrin heavy chain
LLAIFLLTASVSVPAVWSCIGNEQLIQNDVSQAIDSFIKAQDSSNYLAVIQRSSLTDSLKMLEYLQMVRGISKIKDSAIDTELLYVLAKTKRCVFVLFIDAYNKDRL